jgi:competence protein ComEC
VRPSDWRTWTLAGLAAGLAASPAAGLGGARASTFAALGSLGLVALLVAAPAPPRGSTGWLALLVLCGGLAGVGIGALRLAAIDSGAFFGAAGTSASVRGTVLATPHRSNGTVSVRVGTPAGRVLAEADEPVADLPIGREVEAAGELRVPAPWERAYLARYGIARVLNATEIRLTGRRRGGFLGAVDGVRDRSAAALGQGTTPAGAALLRGFVLGEDDRIDEATVNDFRRSGLAHLLAVSGENVALLALLAAPILGLAGVPHRPRLWCLLGLVGLYVLVTGAGPSIQRAGAMGAAALVATLAGRPRARWHVIMLAAVATLAANPRSTGDPGWQLSFAAVIGIMLGAAPIRDALLPPPGRPAGALRRALAEGAGVTVAATLATAPLIAVSFESFSIASLPANLLALPAVAPVMWLGMLDAALGQIPHFPVGLLNAFAGALAGYVAQVAHWLGTPGWAQLDVSAPSLVAVAAIYVALIAGSVAAVGARVRRRALVPGHGVAVAAIAIVALVVAGVASGRRAAPHTAPGRGLRVSVLDVGQGDAILLDPNPGEPILVDGGPPGDGLAAMLRSAGVSRLAAAVVTHDQSDHEGGIEDLLGSFPVSRLVYGVRAPRLIAQARDADVGRLAVAQGSELDSAALRLQVLWPPRELERGSAARGADPNTLAIVAVARWHGFSMLLTADAESEAVPIDPGPVDVLKIAHHGSADAGLAALLERTSPRLAVISVGAGNPFGHPTPETLRTLSGHHVPVMRTDLDGSIAIDATRTGWSAH